jgi:hypothetical protein
MFGCSLTKMCGIPDYFREKGLTVVDFSASAGSNQLQIQRYYDHVQQNVLHNDVIIFQITSLRRPWARLDKTTFLDNRSLYVPKLPKGHHCFVENDTTVDLLCNAVFDHVDPVMLSTNDLLTFLQTLGQNNRLLVWIGHQGFVDEHEKKILDFLHNQKILYCKHYFTEWCLKHKLPFWDSNHPTVESGRQFAEQCLWPMIAPHMVPVAYGSL